ncbi:MAG: elongation factor P [Vampirovibrionia bacterium]
MISTSNFKNGLTIELEGNVMQIVEFLHVKPGKGSAFVRTKLKNVKTGNVVEKTFRAGEKMPQAVLDKNEYQYLYSSGTELNLMNMSTYDQIIIEADVLGQDKLQYLKENDILTILKHGEEILGIDIPIFVELEVTDTPPGEKGNTASGGTKPATTETGASVQVPFFINVGDTIRIDTRTNSYLDRVK